MSRQGATVDEQTRQFLERRRVADPATADARGAPHVVPICFTPLGEARHVVTDEKPKTGDASRLRRLRNIAENPRVAIVADVYDDADWSQLGFARGRGDARYSILPKSRAPRAVAALRRKYPQYRGMALEDRPVIAADVESVTVGGHPRHDCVIEGCRRQTHRVISVSMGCPQQNDGATELRAAGCGVQGAEPWGESPQTFDY